MIEERTDRGLVREYLRRAKRPAADMSAEQFQGRQPGYAYNFGGPRKTRKKISTFTVILYLCGFAVLLVLYIGNIIAVNTLMKENSALEREFEQVRNTNERLRADLNNRTGLEYIGSAAGERLGLINPVEPPHWIAVDKNELDRLARELRKYEPQ
jgi:cell division protein FtsB